MRAMNHLDPRRSTATFLLEGERLCSGCGVRRPLTEWGLNASKPNGFASYRRECERRRSRAYYAANRGAVLARAAAASCSRAGSG
jgi:hypothetical protein